MEHDSVRVGQLVKLDIPGLHGPRRVAGIVKRLLPGGRVEIKSQNDGYHIVDADSVRPVASYDGPHDPPYGREIY